MTRRGRLAFAVLVIALSAASWQGLAGRRPSPELDPNASPLTEGWERPPVPPPNDTYLVAVGEVPSARMSSLVADAEAALAMHVSVLPPLSVNPAMLDTKRSQLTAEEVILAVLAVRPFTPVE